MLNPLLIRTLECLIAFVVTFSAGWVVHGWKYDSQYKEAYKNVLVQFKESQEKNNQISKDYLSQTTKYNQNIGNLSEKLQNEIKINDIYRNCIIPDDGMQLINTAINTTNKVISSK